MNGDVVKTEFNVVKSQPEGKLYVARMDENIMMNKWFRG